MEEVAISEFKAKRAELLARVEKTRKPIRITRHGRPLAEIVPSTKVLDRSEWIGSLQGSMKSLVTSFHQRQTRTSWRFCAIEATSGHAHLVMAGRPAEAFGPANLGGTEERGKSIVAFSGQHVGSR